VAPIPHPVTASITLKITRKIKFNNSTIYFLFTSEHDLLKRSVYVGFVLLRRRNKETSDKNITSEHKRNSVKTTESFELLRSCFTRVIKISYKIYTIKVNACFDV